MNRFNALFVPWVVMQMMLLGAGAHAQVPNDPLMHRTENIVAVAETGLQHIFDYSLPRQTVLLEFDQDECQVSVAKECIIPDVPADPGNAALTTFFDAVCDLGFSTTDAASSLTRPAPREIIQKFLVSSDNFRMLVKFGK